MFLPETNASNPRAAEPRPERRGPEPTSLSGQAAVAVSSEALDMATRGASRYSPGRVNAMYSPE